MNVDGRKHKALSTHPVVERKEDCRGQKSEEVSEGDREHERRAGERFSWRFHLNFDPQTGQDYDVDMG